MSNNKIVIDLCKLLFAEGYVIFKKEYLEELLETINSNSCRHHVNYYPLNKDLVYLEIKNL